MEAKREEEAVHFSSKGFEQAVRAPARGRTRNERHRPSSPLQFARPSSLPRSPISGSEAVSRRSDVHRLLSVVARVCDARAARTRQIQMDHDS